MLLELQLNEQYLEPDSRSEAGDGKHQLRVEYGRRRQHREWELAQSELAWVDYNGNERHNEWVTSCQRRALQSHETMIFINNTHSLRSIFPVQIFLEALIWGLEFRPFHRPEYQEASWIAVSISFSQSCTLQFPDPRDEVLKNPLILDVSQCLDCQQPAWTLTHNHAHILYLRVK